MAPSGSDAWPLARPNARPTMGPRDTAPREAPMPCQGPVHLRRAAVADAAGIAQSTSPAGRRRTPASCRPTTPSACAPRSREDFWRDELNVEASDRKPWVALIDDRIVGFASGGMSRDDDADTRVRRGLPGLRRSSVLGPRHRVTTSSAMSSGTCTTMDSIGPSSGSSPATRRRSAFAEKHGWRR